MWCCCQLQYKTACARVQAHQQGMDGLVQRVVLLVEAQQEGLPAEGQHQQPLRSAVPLGRLSGRQRHKQHLVADLLSGGNSHVIVQDCVQQEQQGSATTQAVRKNAHDSTQKAAPHTIPPDLQNLQTSTASFGLVRASGVPRHAAQSQVTDGTIAMADGEQGCMQRRAHRTA